MPITPIEVSARAEDWNSDDTLVFRIFLETVTAGKKLLPCLLEKTPALLAKGDVNEILIRNGEVRGVQLIAKAFLDLAYPPPEPPKQNNPYPPPEDDSQWPDENPKPQ